MSDATTTADGFWVGQRVRVSNPDDERHGDQGEIIPWQIGDNPTTGLHRIRLDTGGIIARHQVNLIPVENDEPDAPATPEPPADDKPHYYAKLRDAGCEPFAVIRGAHSRDWAIGYHVGTAEAYLLRSQHKHDSPDDDIRKAHAHLTEAVAILDGKGAA